MPFHHHVRLSSKHELSRLTSLCPGEDAGVAQQPVTTRAGVQLLLQQDMLQPGQEKCCAQHPAPAEQEHPLHCTPQFAPLFRLSLPGFSRMLRVRR